MLSLHEILISAVLFSLSTTIFAQPIVTPGSQASHHLPIEPHHSLHHPFDVSMPYWKYGGATVATESFIRLTPSSQSRSGWLFNDYDLQSSDWEVEVHFSVKADFHIGGDGFAIWVLNDAFHPRRYSQHNYLSGPIFGMREDFEGFGVIFDTYDNDNARDNPTIFVIKQEQGSLQQWDNDKDFQPNLIRDVTDANLDFECTADYRNTDRMKVTLRYQKQVLHVYYDDGKGYVFCLAVKVGIETKGQYYLALSALTGQVADQHDIYMITTRFLDEKDKEIDDRKLKRSGYHKGRGISWWNFFFWMGNLAITIYLIYQVVNEMMEFGRIRKDQLNPVHLCQQLNPKIDMAYMAHAVQFGLAVLKNEWGFLLLNLPHVLWRGFSYMTDSHHLVSTKLGRSRGWFEAGEFGGSCVKIGGLVVSLLFNIYKIFKS